MSFKFTSESVSQGHPDKLCDQISDAILDAYLDQDPESRVAIESVSSKDLLIVAGEVRSKGTVDLEKIARKTAIDIGYTDESVGLNGQSCRFIQNVQEQSPDIAQGVDKGTGKYSQQGAGDQGIMFGYACNDTEAFMPLPIQLSHELMEKIQSVRHENTLSYLRPDAKSQVTVHYENKKPLYVDTVVISTQHDESIAQDTLENDIINTIIKPTIPAHLINSHTRFLINPTGRFVQGGPAVDTGLTGRKIIVDTYGGWASHGGGAFSGKDPSKVDRSAAYMARYIAKNIVAAKLAEECLIQLSYAIGFAEPVSLFIDTKNTSELNKTELEHLIRESFNLTPEGIIRSLDLKKPQFANTACLGHFGRDQFSWEKTDKIIPLTQNAKQYRLVTA